MTEITPEVFKHGMNELLLRCETPSANEEDINLAVFEGAMLMSAVLSQVGYKEGAGLFIEMCRTALSLVMPLSLKIRQENKP